MILKLLYSSLLVLSVFQGFSQKLDTIYRLKEVSISSDRLKSFGNGYKVDKIDSNHLKSLSDYNLSDLLAQQSEIYVKSYGAGQLATPSLRGAGASHTAVLWNGFNLQSPMNGQLDLALVPNTFLDQVQIKPGGAGGLFGSGAIGGTIHLDNNIQFDRGLTCAATGTTGSFGKSQQDFQFEISKSRFISSTKLFNSYVKNNFPFINTTLSGSPEVLQTNASLKGYGFLQENHFKVNNNNRLSLRLWYQNNDRQIPPVMSQIVSAADQKDEFYRVSGEWQKTGKKNSYTFRTGYFDEKLNYSDSIFDTYSKNSSKNFINEAEAKFSLNGHQLLNIGINNTYATATSTGYGKKVNREELSIFSSYKFYNSKETWKGILSVRQAWFNGKIIPITPSIALEGLLIKGFSIKGNMARVYRVPTFNDLYWNPGGNPDLVPEEGWSEELGLEHRFTHKTLSTILNVTAFNTKLNNWIIWLPTDYYWTPQNIMQVWSRGLESKLNIDYSIGKVILKFNVTTNYVLSTNQKTKSASDASLDKQLIYVPQYKGHGNFFIIYKGYYFNYNQTYTGYRYVTSDNTDFLIPYQLSNISLSKDLKLKQLGIRVSAQVNNLWNEKYVVLTGRPMPLRNYQIGLTFKFNKPNNN